MIFMIGEIEFEYVVFRGGWLYRSGWFAIGIVVERTIESCPKQALCRMRTIPTNSPVTACLGYEGCGGQSPKIFTL